MYLQITISIFRFLTYTYILQDYVLVEFFNSKYFFYNFTKVQWNIWNKYDKEKYYIFLSHVSKHPGNKVKQQPIWLHDVWLEVLTVVHGNELRLFWAKASTLLHYY